MTYSHIGQEKATAIRDAYATGEYSQTQLAERFGVAQQTVSNIVRGLAYRGEPRKRPRRAGPGRPPSNALTEFSKIADIAAHATFLKSRPNEALAAIRDHYCRTIREVAIHLEVSPQAAGSYVSQLEGMGLVEKAGIMPQLAGDGMNRSAMYIPTPAAHRIPAPSREEREAA